MFYFLHITQTSIINIKKLTRQFPILIIQQQNLKVKAFQIRLHPNNINMDSGIEIPHACRRVASQFFLVSPDSQVDKALAEPIIFRIIFISQNGDKKKAKFLFKMMD